MDNQNKGGQNGGFGGNKDENQGQKRTFSGNRASNGDRKPAYGGGRAQNGERKGGFRGDQPASRGEKSSFGGDHAQNGERKTGFRGDKPAYRGDKPAFGGDRAQNGERKGNFRGDKPAYRGEKSSFGGDRAQNGDRKPSFRGDKPAYRGDKPAFGGDAAQKRGDKPAFGGKKFTRPTGKPGFGGDKVGMKPYSGERKPRPEQMEGLPARRLALEVIRAVTEKDAFISLVLDEKLRDCGLPVVDRRLAARLAYDTIEMQMYLDWVLDQIMAKPDTDIKLRNILRLGSFQILLEDRIPESAACNTSVQLCKELEMEGLAGVCNGILRNLIRQKDELKFPDPEAEPVKALSIRHSVPEWLVEKLLADWGDEAIDLMSTRSHDSYITVRPNLLKMTDEEFEELLRAKAWESEKGRVPHSWRIRNMAEIGHDAGFVGGKFSIQSESSMMAAMAVKPARGMQILDCCAAPGGKSCLMAEMMDGTGRVQAWELHEHRTDLIIAQVKRLGLENVRPMQRDATVYRPDLEGQMDAVLLDAPCSGLGVMADKPDVKYRVTKESVAELAALQQKLLDTVAPYVKQGGTLVYSTCSVLKDENVRQVEAFLARHPEFELQPLPETIPEEFRKHEGTGLQLLPSRDGVEGFYICRMRRKRAVRLI